MLEIQGLSKSYGKNMAVDNVGFTVPDGQVGILLGPNGAGKSTIIKSIAGLLRYKGVIRIQGLPARTVEAKKVFAYVPEIPNMFDALTVREHIEYVRIAYNSGITDDEVEQILKEFEMDDKLDRRLCDLSGGELQRVLLAVATHPAPELLILDEPVSGIDSNGMSVFYEKLDKLKRERDMAILMVSHDLHYVAQHADKMLLIDQTVLSSGTPQQVMASEAFQKEFNVFTKAEGR